MATQKRKEKIFEFSHARKTELEPWLTTDGRLQEVEEALQAVQEMLRAFPARNRERTFLPGESIRLRSLYCFAVVTYVRCFVSGRKPRIDVSHISGLTAKDRKLHDSIRSLRNQHIAHAVADEEGATIYLHPEPDEQKPARYTVISAVLVSDGNAEVRRFGFLVRKVRAYVRTRISDAGDAIAQSHFGSNASWAALSKPQSRK